MKEEVFTVRAKNLYKDGGTVVVVDEGKEDFFNSVMYKNGEKFRVKPLRIWNDKIYKNWFECSSRWSYHRSWLIFKEDDEQLFDFNRLGK